MAGTTARKKTRKSKLEVEYEKLFKPSVAPMIVKETQTSLKQPSQLKIVQSVVTYGAYEEPV